MLKEELFISQLQKTTGKYIGRDFGFIFGTQAPFQVNGAYASNNKPGFEMWEKRGHRAMYHNIILDDKTDALMLCAKLLMQEWPEFAPGMDSAKMEHSFVGEYSADISALPPNHKKSE